MNVSLVFYTKYFRINIYKVRLVRFMMGLTFTEMETQQKYNKGCHNLLKKEKLYASDPKQYLTLH